MTTKIQELFDLTYGEGLFSVSRGIMILNTLLLVLGLCAHDVPADGFCGFWALLSSMRKTVKSLVTKSHVLAFQCEIKDRIVQIYESGRYGKMFIKKLLNGTSLEDWLQGYDHHWCEAVHLEAASELTDRTIVVWNLMYNNETLKPFLNYDIWPKTTAFELGQTDVYQVSQMDAIHIGTVQCGSAVGRNPTNHFVWIDRSRGDEKHVGDFLERDVMYTVKQCIEAINCREVGYIASAWLPAQASVPEAINWAIRYVTQRQRQISENQLHIQQQPQQTEPNHSVTHVPIVSASDNSHPLGDSYDTPIELTDEPACQTSVTQPSLSLLLSASPTNDSVGAHSMSHSDDELIDLAMRELAAQTADSPASVSSLPSHQCASVPSFPGSQLSSHCTSPDQSVVTDLAIEIPIQDISDGDFADDMIYESESDESIANDEESDIIIDDEAVPSKSAAYSCYENAELALRLDNIIRACRAITIVRKNTARTVFCCQDAKISREDRRIKLDKRTVAAAAIRNHKRLTAQQSKKTNPLSHQQITSVTNARTSIMLRDKNLLPPVQSPDDAFISQIVVPDGSPVKSQSSCDMNSQSVLSATEEPPSVDNISECQYRVSINVSRMGNLARFGPSSIFNHTCEPLANPRVNTTCNQVVLSHYAQRELEINTDIKGKDFIKKIAAAPALGGLDQDIADYKARGAIIHAKDHMWGDREQQYARIPLFLRLLTSINPATLTRFDADIIEATHPAALKSQLVQSSIKHNSRIAAGSNVQPRPIKLFKSAAFTNPSGIQAAIRARPVFFVDATFRNGREKGTILCASSIDANNQLIPLAFALVPSESHESWTMFFELIDQAVEKASSGAFQPKVIVSDRNASILHAASVVWPQAMQSYCLRHLIVNVRTNCGIRLTDAMNKLIFKAAKAPTSQSFDVYFDQLPESVQLYLRPLIPHWTNYSFDGWRFDQVTSNCAESICAKLKPIKSYLPIFFLVSLYDIVREWMNSRINDAKQTTCKLSLTDYARTEVQKTALDARFFTCQPGEVTSNTRQFTIQSKSTYHVSFPTNPHLNRCTVCGCMLRAGADNSTCSDTSHQLDVQLVKCSCGLPNSSGLLCSHSIKAARHIGLPVERLVTPYYSQFSYCRTYPETVRVPALPPYQSWMQLDASSRASSDFDIDQYIIAPLMRTKAGKPRLNRFLGMQDGSAKRRSRAALPQQDNEDHTRLAGTERSTDIEDDEKQNSVVSAPHAPAKQPKQQCCAKCHRLGHKTPTCPLECSLCKGPHSKRDCPKKARLS